MDDLPDLETVLDEAVRVYLIAKKRSALQRYPKDISFSADELVDKYPDYFVRWSNPTKIRVIGKSADVILEEYLAKLGYPVNSDLWYSLAHIVIERGEYESDVDRDFERPRRRRRSNYGRVR